MKTITVKKKYYGGIYDNNQHQRRQLEARIRSLLQSASQFIQNEMKYDKVRKKERTRPGGTSNCVGVPVPLCSQGR
jgi:hypothetical protein